MPKSAPRPSPLSRPEVKEFLDGIAELIVDAILEDEGAEIEDAEPDPAELHGGGPC